MVSVLLLTINRFQLTKEISSHNLTRANYPFELLVLDNGSTQPELINFIDSLNPAVFIKSKSNQGVAKGLNVLMKLAKGTHFFHMANDILLPQNWLRELMVWYENVPNAGMAGIHCVETLHPLNEHGVHAGWNVFGSSMISRQVVEMIGYYNEDYNPYGLEDSDYHWRLNKSGFVNFYIPGMTSEHRAHDVGEQSEYRKMKDESLAKNLQLFSDNINRMDATGNYYISDDPIINQMQYFGEYGNSIFKGAGGI